MGILTAKEEKNAVYRLNQLQSTSIFSTSESLGINTSDPFVCQYKYVNSPPITAYQELWEFLRNGGFNCTTNTVTDCTGRAPESFEKYLGELMKS